MGVIIDYFAKSIFIKPKLNLTQWSEKYRILSKESSSHYGAFKSFSYQVEPMNEISNPKRRKVVLLWASQLGKSEMINNTIGYYIHQEPSTILFMLPNEIDAEDYSKRRLAPMFRDCHELNEIINSNSESNTILIKNFKGGNLALVGSNSVSKLASKPIKVLLIDEADRCETTKEGDPIKLAEKRTVTFLDKKIIISSTPTIKGTSRVENEFLNSDMRYFYVKCPHCGFAQTLKFEGIVWSKLDDGSVDYESVRYSCAECGSLLNEQDKNTMVKNGIWKAKNPKSSTAGFFLNALYSPFYTLKDIAKDFLESKNDASKLQTFVNTIKAQSFEPPSVNFDDDELYQRKELYTAENFPYKAQFITAGVDIQADRIEMNFIGWADGFEAFNIEHIKLYGSTEQSKVWEDTFTALHKPFIREDGKIMNITLACVDSGFKSEEVYKMVANSKKLIATKGLSEVSTKADFIGNIKNIKKGVRFVNIGTYKGKSEVFRMLQIKEEGEGYFHFSSTYTKEYFLQLTAEKLQKIRNRRGYEKLQWVKTRERNEALDLTVLALAAARIIKRVKRKRPRLVQRS